MKYNFDQIIDRHNTNSLKYDFAVERGRSSDILPLWVADMDFPAPQGVIDALSKASLHGIFGYSDTKDDYFNAVSDWFTKHHSFTPTKESLVKTPGIVYAICMALQAYTKAGDSVLIQQPVYYPFYHSIVDNERKPVINELVYENGSYQIDFEDFEKKIIDHNVKMFLLCSPHNPVGRVWTREELIRMGDICVKHDVLIVSDEIHADFTYPGYTHTIFSSLKPEFEDRTILCTAPSKTFNIAGLQVSNIFISNAELRKLFVKAIDKSGYSQLNSLGLVACQAAYETGEEWLSQLKVYLEDNLSYVRTFLKENLPQVKLVEPEGTYLIWLDFKALNLSDYELNELITKKANLWLDGGTMFGASGSGFQRINLACPRSIIEQCMEQLKTALSE